MSRAISTTERRDRLRLARTENVGPVTYRELMGRYASATRALDALPHLARRGGRIAPLKIVSIADADRELEAGDRLGATLITLGEAAFPPPLAALDPPPPLVWALGHPSLLHKPAVAVVGARIASAAGQRFARAIAMELGQAGLVVVSGLARGIDGAAHEGALATGTVAVLAGGVDDIYPPEHKALYAQIRAQGCLVSENAVGRRATARDFPRRNRIISGLSLGVVVVEAEQRSGSLITARLANEQGREVFAVPGSPLDPRAKGPNDGARRRGRPPARPRPRPALAHPHPLRRDRPRHGRAGAWRLRGAGGAVAGGARGALAGRSGGPVRLGSSPNTGPSLGRPSHGIAAQDRVRR